MMEGDERSSAFVDNYFDVVVSAVTVHMWEKSMAT